MAIKITFLLSLCLPLLPWLERSLSQRCTTSLPFPFSLTQSVTNISPKTSTMIYLRCKFHCIKALRILSVSRTNSASSTHPFSSLWKRKAKTAWETVWLVSWTPLSRHLYPQKVLSGKKEVLTFAIVYCEPGLVLGFNLCFILSL